MADPFTLAAAGAGIADLAGGTAAVGAGASALASGATAGAGGLGTVGLATSAGGGLLSGISSIFGGLNKSSMLRYQAGIARQNQQIQSQNAEYERNVGEVKAQQSGMASRFQAGQILTTQAASGINVNSGSNKLVQQSQEDLAAHDQDVIRANAAKKAFGFDVEAAQEGSKASMYDIGASEAKTEGAVKAAGTFLGTAASVSDKWLWGQQKGMWGNSGASA